MHPPFHSVALFMGLLSFLYSLTFWLWGIFGVGVKFFEWFSMHLPCAPVLLVINTCIQNVNKISNFIAS